MSESISVLGRLNFFAVWATSFGTYPGARYCALATHLAADVLRLVVGCNWTVFRTVYLSVRRGKLLLTKTSRKQKGKTSSPLYA